MIVNPDTHAPYPPARHETFAPFYGNSAVDVMRDEATREDHRVSDGNRRRVDRDGRDVTEEDWRD